MASVGCTQKPLPPGADRTSTMLRAISGKVKKRKKRLSKGKYGTSHTVSLDEAKHIYDQGAEHLIIGAGQDGNVTLSDEAEEYFQRKACSVESFSTPEAVRAWNQATGKTIGMFHVTC